MQTAKENLPIKWTFEPTTDILGLGDAVERNDGFFYITLSLVAGNYFYSYKLC